MLAHAGAILDFDGDAVQYGSGVDGVISQWVREMFVSGEFRLKAGMWFDAFCNESVTRWYAYGSERAFVAHRYVR